MSDLTPRQTPREALEVAVRDAVIEAARCRATLPCQLCEARVHEVLKLADAYAADEASAAHEDDRAEAAEDADLRHANEDRVREEGGFE